MGTVSGPRMAGVSRHVTGPTSSGRRPRPTDDGTRSDARAPGVTALTADGVSARAERPVWILAFCAATSHHRSSSLVSTKSGVGGWGCQYLPKASATLCPPNPNELLIAYV
jgi:hypothetical protein